MADNNAINNDIGVATGTSLNLGSSTTMTGMIDDDTMGTASNSTAASSESIKAYVDSVSGGGLVLVDSATASSSASIPFINLSSTYQVYLLEMSNVAPATDDDALYVQLSANNGSSYITANYRWAAFVNIDTPASGSEGSASASSMVVTSAATGIKIGNNTNESLSGFIKLYNLSSASTLKKIVSDVTYTDPSARIVGSRNSGIYAGSISAMNAFRVGMVSGGNIASGEFRLYGMVNA